MADIYFYQGDTDEDEGGYSDSSITTPSQVTKCVMEGSDLYNNCAAG